MSTITLSPGTEYQLSQLALNEVDRNTVRSCIDAFQETSIPDLLEPSLEGQESAYPLWERSVNIISTLEGDPSYALPSMLRGDGVSSFRVAQFVLTNLVNFQRIHLKDNNEVQSQIKEAVTLSEGVSQASSTIKQIFGATVKATARIQDPTNSDSFSTIIFAESIRAIDSAPKDLSAQSSLALSSAASQSPLSPGVEFNLSISPLNAEERSIIRACIAQYATTHIPFLSKSSDPEANTLHPLWERSIQILEPNTQFPVYQFQILMKGDDVSNFAVAQHILVNLVAMEKIQSKEPLAKADEFTSAIVQKIATSFKEAVTSATFIQAEQVTTPEPSQERPSFESMMKDFASFLQQKPGASTPLRVYQLTPSTSLTQEKPDFGAMMSEFADFFQKLPGVAPSEHKSEASSSVSSTFEDLD